MELFVPGRICLFGEHSDWAGGYRRVNSDLEKGYTIITGTSQGLYADIQPHPSKLILSTTFRDGTKKGPFKIEMERRALFEEAQKGGFFSYACGVAYQIITHYHVRGLVIDNHKTSLPIKKGLSSSAAICVLVSRAFNRIYDLKMTVRGEMEYAYQGEITTPSRCGRMDQGCAYGKRPILMTFDGDRIDIKELKVPQSLYWVIVDLNAGKDSKEILARLNACFPFASDDMQKEVQRYLGPINKSIVEEAIEALQTGNAKKLGQLMKQAQKEFDEHLMQVCPSQLTAPVLHKVLNYEPIQEHIYGGKGVGSQGDGTAQLIAKNKNSQKRAMEILERDFAMPCLPMIIETSQKIRKAVIPAAGFGTRLFPASKAVKKEFFPIIDSNGRIKPAILIIVEEALSSGIEEVAIIVQERDLPLLEDFFFTPPLIENYNKLSRENQRYSDYLVSLGNHVTLLKQEIQQGFGHAVYCSREWVDGEPFLLLLGDHIYTSGNDVPCAKQLMDVYERYGISIVGLKKIYKDDLKSFGCATGVWEDDALLSITAFSEKPQIEYAEEHLRVDAIEENNYLGMLGQYVLSPKVFAMLERNISANIREGGEFQLTSCLDQLRKEEGCFGFLPDGKSYDIGAPEKYQQALVEYPQA